jgi:hypothetical protein
MPEPNRAWMKFPDKNFAPKKGVSFGLTRRLGHHNICVASSEGLPLAVPVENALTPSTSLSKLFGQSSPHQLTKD